MISEAVEKQDGLNSEDEVDETRESDIMITLTIMNETGHMN